MILLDTHIWIWWTTGDERLSARSERAINESLETTGAVGISVISCWGVAMSVSLGRLELNEDVQAWLDRAVSIEGVELLPLTPAIAVESTRLPEPFHKDPGDRLIVATARVRSLPLLTIDEKIARYPHVRLVQ